MLLRNLHNVSNVCPRYSTYKATYCLDKGYETNRISSNAAVRRKSNNRVLSSTPSTFSDKYTNYDLESGDVVTINKSQIFRGYHF